MYQGEDPITYSIPWFCHETGDNIILHPDTLGGQLEQNRVICHPEGIGISKGGFQHTRPRLRIYTVCQSREKRSSGEALRCPSIATSNWRLVS